MLNIDDIFFFNLFLSPIISGHFIRAFCANHEKEFKGPVRASFRPATTYPDKLCMVFLNAHRESNFFNVYVYQINCQSH